MNRYVTGCKHFRDPVHETEYNSFATQSDKCINTYANLSPNSDGIQTEIGMLVWHMWSMLQDVSPIGYAFISFSYLLNGNRLISDLHKTNHVV